MRPELGTEFPIQFGGGVLVEGPYRLRGRLALGYLPGAYLNLANSIASGVADGYEEDQARLVRSAFRQSLVTRTQLGWRPFEDAGFYTHFSYTTTAFGGSVRSADAVDATLGAESLPIEVPSTDIDVDTNAHLIGFELGWEFDLPYDLMLRLALGWSYTVSAGVDVDVEYEANDPEVRQGIADFESDAERVIRNGFETYFPPPTIGIGVGWNF